MDFNNKENQKIVSRLSNVGIFGNLLLSSFKLTAGIFGKSGAMVSDAIHSLSDVFATLIAFIGTRISQKSPDNEHPYGHERFECIATILLGCILIITGTGIGWSGINNIITGAYKTISVPTLLPLIAAIISIIVKEGMFHYTMHYAKKLDSAAFKADAWHHRSDALSSIGSFAGIFASRLGFPIMDSVASIIICLFILKVGIDVIVDSFKKMLDTSCDECFECQISDLIKSVKGVNNIDLLNTRMFGNRIYIDVEIAVDKNSSLIQAHDIAENVHDKIETSYPKVKHVMVHVNPDMRS